MGGKLAVGGGIGGVIVVILSLLFGGDPSESLNADTPGGFSPAAQPGANPELDAKKRFVKIVLEDTENVWNRLFREQLGQTYQEPVLVLFSGRDQSGCGTATSATGPFYCPADRQVYIDLSFYDQLQSQFQAPGDFAMAYVVAHEVGHHVQHLLGISDKVHARQSGMSKEDANALSVRLELQADFLAGVWAHHARDSANVSILEAGDIEEALGAANAIGDDRLQMEAQGYVVPDAFTHGTSEQRMQWFNKGYKTGDLSQGDTFEGIL